MVDEAIEDYEKLEPGMKTDIKRELFEKSLQHNMEEDYTFEKVKQARSII